MRHRYQWEIIFALLSVIAWTTPIALRYIPQQYLVLAIILYLCGVIAVASLALWQITQRRLILEKELESERQLYRNDICKYLQLVINQVLNLTTFTILDTRSIQLRSNIMLIKNDRLYIKYHSLNMENDPDLEFKPQKGIGVSGAAWARGELVVGDTSVPELPGAPSWGLTAEEKVMTKKAVSILCIPIWRTRHSDETNKEIIGVFSIDSSESLNTTKFREELVRERATLLAGALSLLVEGIADLQNDGLVG